MISTRASFIVTIVVVGVLPLIMVLGNSMFIPLLPLIQDEMNLTMVQSGMVLTMFTVPAAIVIPIIGMLSDRFGRKKMIIISLYIIVFGIVLTSIGQLFSERSEWFLILVGRAFQGIGAGGTTPLAMAMIGDLFEGEKRSEGLGFIEVFNGIGKVISPIIGGLFAIFIWFYSFYFYLLIVLFAIITISFTIEETAERRNHFHFNKYINKIVKIVKREYKWILPVFLASGVGLFILFGMLFFLSFELEQVYQIEGFKKGVYLAAPLSGLTIFSYLTGKKVGMNINQIKRYMIFGMLLFFSAFSCLIFFHQLTSLLTYSTMGACALGLFLPAANTAVTSSVGSSERGLVVSLYNMVRFLGVALGPVLFGVWMYDLTEMFFMAVGLIGISMVILISTWNCVPLFKECSTKII